MATRYPNGIDGNTQLPLAIDGATPVTADTVNNTRNAVIAVQTELGVNPSSTFGTVKDRIDYIENVLDLVTDGYRSSIRITRDSLSGGIEVPTDKTYTLMVYAPYSGFIDSTYTQSTAGTATATFEIDGYSLGGGSNSISTSLDTVVHTTGNTFLEGSTITLVVSGVSSVTDLSFTVIIIRTD